MTKTIEFVEQNIFECKNHIQCLNSKINEDKKYPSLVKCHKERIEELKPILQNLEQIKCELEAWEIIKREILITDGGVIHLAIEDDNIDYETIKKALEIKDE